MNLQKQLKFPSTPLYKFTKTKDSQTLKILGLTIYKEKLKNKHKKIYILGINVLNLKTSSPIMDKLNIIEQKLDLYIAINNPLKDLETYKLLKKFENSSLQDIEKEIKNEDIARL